MRACILNSQTKVVENIIVLNQEDFENFIPYKDGIELAPQHDGEIGWTWTDSGWVKPPEPEIPDEELILLSRARRDSLLVSFVDTLNPIRWETMTEEKKNEWRAYRQDLLDVPQQSGFPRNIIWPTKPE